MWCQAASQVCRLSDLVVSPGLLSLSGDLTTQTVAIYAYMHMYNNINNDNAFLHCLHTHTRGRTHIHTLTHMMVFLLELQLEFLELFSL